MELPDRDDRDDDAAALLALLLLRYWQELIDLLGEPPDASSVPDSFWHRVEQETGDQVATVLLAVFLASAQLHGATGAERLALAIPEALQWSARHAQRVAELINGTSRDMLSEFAADWRERMAAGERIPTSEVRDRITRIFGASRAARIAVDAVTAAQTAGGEWAVGRFAELSDADQWSTVGDERVCPVCAPLDGQPRTVWREVAPNGPPAHPVCRCALLYVALTD